MIHPAVQDARAAWTLGLERGGHLLTAGELGVLRRVLGLRGEAALVHARLSGRVGADVRDDDLDPGAVRELLALGLCDRLVPPRRRAELLTVPELADLCRAAGRAATGRKADLVERAAGLRVRGSFLRVQHRELLRRLERWAALSPWPERSAPVIERLGLVRWPAYSPTPGPSLHADRRALLRWESALHADDAVSALAALRAGDGRGPAGLDLRRTLRRVVRASAEELERADAAAAAGRYAELVAWGERPGRVAARRALCLERAGRPREAWRVLREALPDAAPAEQVAIVRTGRRLGRQLRTGFPPLPPRAPLQVRSLRLARAGGSGARPLWVTPEGPRTIEQAVVLELRGRGRGAVHDEGATLRTIGTLLLAELLFLPVPGALPVPRLPAPLDLGTPAFRGARAEAFARLTSAVAAGEGSAIVRRAWVAHAGTRLAGADWALGEERVLAVAGALPAAALRALALAVADGTRFTGLPDLLVLPGPEIELEGAWPRRVPPGLVAAEVKGPGDTLRDGQVGWLDALARLGLRAELWEVSAW